MVAPGEPPQVASAMLADVKQFVEDRAQLFPAGQPQKARDHDLDDVADVPALVLQRGQAPGLPVAAPASLQDLLAVGEPQGDDPPVKAMPTPGPGAAEGEQDPVRVEVGKLRYGLAGVPAKAIQLLAEVADGAGYGRRCGQRSSSLWQNRQRNLGG